MICEHNGSFFIIKVQVKSIIRMPALVFLQGQETPGVAEKGWSGRAFTEAGAGYSREEEGSHALPMMKQGRRAVMF